ncbi:cellulase family glycosylhydrolase [Dysgonomonas sp. 520]|uniref:cellulase family glycosylhydrolase n=1 Tax=Dysgonomonas sp. 520 TaxID=2302931 RepID=UPI0013D07222|nr:cellulase family glycosylhydrolase [Dysgonomonas sp. 520]NDW08568.1 hypothetical protein [Dysgonomonas sp. 520]
MKKYLFLIIISLFYSHSVSSQIQEIINSPWGVSAHPTTDREWQNIDTLIAKVRDAGINWIREDYKFGYICKDKSEFTFSRYDSLLSIAERNNIQILPILEAYDNELKSSGRTDVIPIYEHPEEWRRFVRETVKRYHHKLKYWEIWNEQDGGFWKPSPDAKQYVSLLKIAYEEIKNIDTDCKVVVGGMCSWNADYLEAMYKNGAKGYFDIIAVHPYNHAPDVNLKTKRMREEMLAVIKKYDSKRIPIWITEFGGTSFTGQLAEQQPNFVLDAIHYSLNKLNIKNTDKLKIGLAVSPRTKNLDEVERTRTWLPGIEIEPITLDKLATLNVKEYPVLIGSEGVNIDEPMLAPMLEYIKRGGLLVTANQIPFYTVHSQDKDGIWQLADRVDITHPFFRMAFDAWWLKEGLPQGTNEVKLSDDALKNGLFPVSDIYVDRYLTDRNMKDGDKYYPIIKAYHNDEYIGDGMALYTYNDWKGGLLVSTVSLTTGYTEKEQANLLQRIYLTYLSLGVEKMFWYDLHSDGMMKGEKEHNFGLLNYDWSPKKAYKAYSEMTSILGKNPVFEEKIRGKNSSVWALIFRNNQTNDKILAIWSTDKNEASVEIVFEKDKKEQITLNNSEVKFITVNDYKKIIF